MYESHFEKHFFINTTGNRPLFIHLFTVEAHMTYYLNTVFYFAKLKRKYVLNITMTMYILK